MSGSTHPFHIAGLQKTFLCFLQGQNSNEEQKEYEGAGGEVRQIPYSQHCHRRASNQCAFLFAFSLFGDSQPSTDAALQEIVILHPIPATCARGLLCSTSFLCYRNWRLRGAARLQGHEQQGRFQHSQVRSSHRHLTLIRHR